MKRIQYILSVVLLVVFAFTGCIDDDLVKTNDVVEGKPVTVSLKIGYKADADVVVNTRADNTLSDITRLRIFVYDAQGNYMESLNYTGNTASDKITLTETSTTDNGHLYTARFKTTSGIRKLIVVANAGGGYWQTPSLDIENTSYEDMKKAVISLSTNLAVDGVTPFQIVASSQMLLTGCQDGIVFTTDNGVTDINGNKLSPAISLCRAMARITFKIPEKVSNANGIFTPTTYQVYNVPIKTMLSNDEKAVDASASGEKFINFASTIVPSVYDGYYTFSFYMPENIYDIRSDVSDYKSRDLWDKPTDSKISSPTEKCWKNAPLTSTFIVISGTYTGCTNVDDSGNITTTETPVIGNVEYTIHLGDFSGAAGTYGNFSVERNVSYTYNVSVLGVDNIIVEAITNKENQSGAEGEIYDNHNTQYTYNLDAHYEQVYLEYNLSEIAKNLTSGLDGEALDNAIGSQLILVIQSEAMNHTANGVINKRGSLNPYKIYADAVRDKNGEEDAVSAAQQAKYEILNGSGEGENPTKGFDYKWIEFWPQTSSNIAAYPGISSWAKEDLTDMKNKDFYEGDATDNAKYLMDVYDVIVEMGKVVKKIYNNPDDITIGTEANRTEGKILISEKEGDYVARFTAFVNEYFYLHHPLTGMKVTNWSVMTNKIPREMIIAMSTNTSDDEQSSYSKIHSYISQLSMQTFYSSRTMNLNGFGIETYNETPLTFLFNDFQLPDEISLTDSDGRINQIYLLNKMPNADDYGLWKTYINSEQNGWIKTVGTEHVEHKLNNKAYNIQKAYSACLSRNRDLNGNGKIDPNEVRWYLASLNEYLRMGIGANAISSAARLYIGDKSAMEGSRDGYQKRYIDKGSLFYTSSSNNKRLYWAVEKGSYSVIGSYTTIDGKEQGVPIRCIRMMPATKEEEQKDISSIEDILADKTYSWDGDKRILTFKGILVDALYRQRSSNSLDPHHEGMEANSYCDGIFVAKNISQSQYRLKDIIQLENKNNPCSTYSEEGDGGATWRVPNLIEFTAMNAEGILKDDDKKKELACCTQFSNQNIRYGFATAGDLITCPGRSNGHLENEYYVRCVRDVP